MLTLLFIIFMIGFLFKGIGMAFEFSWGLIKVLLTVVFWPIILIGMVVLGLIKIALPLLIIAGIIMLVVHYLERDPLTYSEM